jgi:hypothetical protein
MVLGQNEAEEENGWGLSISFAVDRQHHSHVYVVGGAGEQNLEHM